jgi:hypothetical protein
MRYFIVFIFLFGCEEQSKEMEPWHYKPCYTFESGKAVLVAYKVAAHSHIWFQDPKTKRIFHEGTLGGRKEPTVSLGDTINVHYCDGTLMFDKNLYVKSPMDRSSRFKCLGGYYHLNR